MLIVQPHPDHPSELLSLAQVQELLNRGLAHNKAMGLTENHDREMWVRERLLNRVNPAALTAKGWETVATVISLEPVTCIEQVQQLIEIFTDNLPTPPHQKSLEGMFYLFARHHNSFAHFSFEQLVNIARLVMELYREQGEQAYISINTVLHQCDASLMATPALRIPGAYFPPEGMFRPEHLESFRRRIRIGLLAQEPLRPVDLALYIVEHSSLPEAQREFLSSRWGVLSRQFQEQPAGVDLGGLSLPFAVARAISAVEKINSLVDSMREQGLGTFDMKCVLEQLGNCSAIRESCSLLERLPHCDKHDLLQFFEQFAAKQSVAVLTNLVRFSEAHQIPFRMIPTALGKLVPEILDRYRYKTPPYGASSMPEFGPGQKRTTEELMELGRELGTAMQYAISLSERELDVFVELYDRVRAGVTPWNFRVVAEFARRFQNHEPRALHEREVRQLYLALGVYKRLMLIDREPSQAARISLDYATTDTYKNSSNRVVLKSLLESDPDQFMSKAIIEQARNPKISNKLFLQTLTLAGNVYPGTWGLLPGMLGDSPDSSRVSVGTLRAAVSKVQLGSFGEISRAAMEERDIQHERLVRDHLVAYIQAASLKERRAAGSTLRELYNLDTGPYPLATAHDDKQVNPEYRKMWNEVMEVYRGVFDLHYGFGHSTFECKAPPKTEDWMLLRFAFDSAIRVSRLVSSDANAFPGPGCLISGLRLERLFAANPATPDDPYSLFKEAWRWVAPVIEDLPRTSFLMSRGVKMFIGPDEPTYKLDGVHYALVVWNDHFDNRRLDAAALVPVSVIELALRGRIKRIDNLGDRPTAARSGSAVEVGLKFHELKLACEERNIPFLNLGWASNMGGLCNAYAPCSPPYFEWERQLATHDKDGAGHIHKSHIKGHYVATADAETTRLLLPLRQAHDAVYGVTSAYLGLSDLFRISLALWHKGLTLTEQMGEERELEIEAGNEEESLSANELKMLEEAYRWNDLHEQNAIDREAFPILCIARTFDSWNMTTSPVMLDTYDLTLCLADGTTVSLDRRSDHVPDSLIGLWAARVRPLYRNRVELDLRFLDRRSVRWGL